jgi:hypothetical protein
MSSKASKKRSAFRKLFEPQTLRAWDVGAGTKQASKLEGKQSDDTSHRYYDVYNVM